MVYRSYQDIIYNLYRGEKGGLRICRNVTFQVCDACNYACTYCYEHHKSNNFMTNDIAKEIIDFLFVMYEKDDKKAFINKDTKAIILDFIGGEPLLAIDVIDYACSYFWDKALRLRHPWADTFMISMISNGELYFEEKVQNFLYKFKDRLSFGITIDGNKEMHDACRVRHDGSGTWEKANASQLDWHKKRGKEKLETKVTISPDNLKHFGSTVKYFIDNGYTEINANPIYEHEWTKLESLEYYCQLKETSNYLLKHENVYFSRYHKYGYMKMNEEEDQLFCGGAGEMLAFDPHGDAYPCIRYMESSLNGTRKPLKIGSYKEGIYKTEEALEVKRMFESMTRQTFLPQECLDCPINSGCGYCIAWCYEKNGKLDKRDTSTCWMHRAASLAYVYYMCNKKQSDNDRLKVTLLPKEIATQIISEEEYEMLKNMSEKYNADKKDYKSLRQDK